MREYNNIPRPDFTPERITRLQPDEVFVFGSNLDGMLGGGAARMAAEVSGTGRSSRLRDPCARWT